MPEIMEAILRAVFAFLVLLVLARLIGRRENSQLTFFDLVAGTSIGGIGAVLAADTGISIWVSLAALLTFITLLILTDYLALESRPLRKLMRGEPVVVVHNGKILEGNLAQMRIGMDALTTQMREKGYFNISDVEYAVMETDGNLSVLPKSQHRPMTPQDLKIPTQYEGINSELIMDGKVVEQNLLQNKLSKTWLLEQLKAQGIFSVGEVSFASLDAQGNLYVDKKQDVLEQVTDMSDKEI